LIIIFIFITSVLITLLNPKISFYIVIILAISGLSIMPDDVFFNERHLLTIILFIYIIIKNNFKIKRLVEVHNNIDIFLVIFFLYVTFSYFKSGHELYGFKSFINFGNCILLYILFKALIKTYVDIDKFLTVVIFTTLFINVYYWFRSYGFELADRFMNRYEPNATALSVVVLVPFVISRIQSSDFRKKYVNIVILLCMVFIIFATGSRTGMIGLFFSLLLVVLLSKRKSKTILSLSVILVTFVTLLLITGIKMPERTVNFITSPSDDFEYGNILYRKARALAAYKMFLLNPVMGVGLGNYSSYAPRYGIRYESATQSSHNEYMRLLAELGLIGFIVYVIIIYKTFKIAYKNRNKHFPKRRGNLTLSNAFFVSFISLLIINFSLNSLLYNYWTYITIAGIIVFNKIKGLE